MERAVGHCRALHGHTEWSINIVSAEHLELPLYIKTIRGKSRDNSENPAIGFAVFDMNGEPVTRSLAKSVCKDIVAICNKHYEHELRKGSGKSAQTLVYLNIPIEPMDKPDCGVVVKDNRGNYKAVVPPVYAKYMKEFDCAYMASEIRTEQTLPIDCKCQVTVLMYCSSISVKNITAYVDGVLDCLVYSGIIKSKSNRIVNNTDGSRIFTDEKKPRVEIWIRKWE